MSNNTSAYWCFSSNDDRLFSSVVQSFNPCLLQSKQGGLTEAGIVLLVGQFICFCCLVTYLIIQLKFFKDEMSKGFQRDGEYSTEEHANVLVLTAWCALSLTTLSLIVFVVDPSVWNYLPAIPCLILNMFFFLGLGVFVFVCQYLIPHVRNQYCRLNVLMFMGGLVFPPGITSIFAVMTLNASSMDQIYSFRDVVEVFQIVLGLATMINGTMLVHAGFDCRKGWDKCRPFDLCGATSRRDSRRRNDSQTTQSTVKKSKTTTVTSCISRMEPWRLVMLGSVMIFASLSAGVRFLYPNSLTSFLIRFYSLYVVACNLMLCLITWMLNSIFSKREHRDVKSILIGGGGSRGGKSRGGGSLDDIAGVDDAAADNDSGNGIRDQTMSLRTTTGSTVHTDAESGRMYKNKNGTSSWINMYTDDATGKKYVANADDSTTTSWLKSSDDDSALFFHDRRKGKKEEEKDIVADPSNDHTDKVEGGEQRTRPTSLSPSSSISSAPPEIYPERILSSQRTSNASFKKYKSRSSARSSLSSTLVQNKSMSVLGLSKNTHLHLKKSKSASSSTGLGRHERLSTSSSGRISTRERGSAASTRSISTSCSSDLAPVVELVERKENKGNKRNKGNKDSESANSVTQRATRTRKKSFKLLTLSNVKLKTEFKNPMFDTSRIGDLNTVKKEKEEVNNQNL